MKKYITGYNIANLPVEEVLFFFIVPYCCMFIYACIRAYFPFLKEKKVPIFFLKALAVILLIAGAFYHEKYYTSWTFILNAVFIAVIYFFQKLFQEFLMHLLSLVSYAVCLIPFLIVNGFLTAIPVVIYNDAENLGIRIYTIPFEDTFYGMLLVFMNVVGYEKFKNRPL